MAQEQSDEPFPDTQAVGADVDLGRRQGHGTGVPTQ